MDENNAKYHNNLGYVDTQLWDCPDAEKEFQKANLNGEDLANAAYNLGGCYFGIHEEDKAAIQFDVVQRYPGSSGLLQSYAKEMLARIKSHQSMPVSQLSEERKNFKRFGGILNLDFFQFDTNVVSLPGALSPVATQGGIATGGSLLLWGKAIETPEHELSLNYILSGIYHPDSSFIDYDLWSHSLTVPYLFKSQLFGNRSRLTLTPGVSFMQGQVNGIRAVPSTHGIMNSYFLQSQLSVYTRSNQQIESHLNLRDDTSFFPISNSEDNASGPALVAGGSFTQYTDKSMMRNYTCGINLELVNSVGINYRQLKPSVFVGYSMPLGLYSLRAASLLTLLYDDYFTSQMSRQDKQLKLDLNVLRNFNEQVYLSESLSVQSSASNNEIGNFFRFVTTTTLNVRF